MHRHALMAGLVGAGLLSSVPASAGPKTGLTIVVGSGHAYHHDGYRDYDHHDARRVAYSHGYENGFDHGKDDGEDRDGFNFWHDKEYRNGDKGYKGHYGSRGRYQHSFRSGYEAGYRRAYSHFQHRHDHRRCRDGYYTREIPRYYLWR